MQHNHASNRFRRLWLDWKWGGGRWKPKGPAEWRWVEREYPEFSAWTCFGSGCICNCAKCRHPRLIRIYERLARRDFFTGPYRKPQYIEV